MTPNRVICKALINATYYGNIFAIDFSFVFDEMENLREIECVIERYEMQCILPINQSYVSQKWEFINKNYIFVLFILCFSSNLSLILSMFERNKFCTLYFHM